MDCFGPFQGSIFLISKNIFCKHWIRFSWNGVQKEIHESPTSRERHVPLHIPDLILHLNDQIATDFPRSEALGRAARPFNQRESLLRGNEAWGVGESGRISSPPHLHGHDSRLHDVHFRKSIHFPFLLISAPRGNRFVTLTYWKRRHNAIIS